jgi:hypothetical protein
VYAPGQYGSLGHSRHPHIEAPIANGIALMATLRLSDPGGNITFILPIVIYPDFMTMKDVNIIDNFSKVIEDSIVNCQPQ